VKDETYRKDVAVVRENLIARNLWPLFVRICSEHFTRPPEVLAGSRMKKAAAARHHFIAVVRWSLGLSYPEIGKMLGGFDHSTIMCAERKWERVLADRFALSFPLLTPREDEPPERTQDTLVLPSIIA